MEYEYDTDSAVDYVRWLDFQTSETGQTKSLNDQFFVIIHSLKDPALAYFFTLEHNYKPFKAQQLIIEKKNSLYSYLFAKNIPNADIYALQDVVINSNNYKFITKFGCFVKGANIKRIQSLIIKKGQACHAHTYLKYGPFPKINKLKQIILQSKKPSYLFELAKHLNSKKEIAHIEDLLINLKSWTYIRLMAQHIKLVNLEKLEQAILDSENVPEMIKFANSVKNTKLKNFSIFF